MIGRVCELAFQYAHVNGIQRFSEETQLAGRKWLRGFLSLIPTNNIKKGVITYLLPMPWAQILQLLDLGLHFLIK